MTIPMIIIVAVTLPLLLIGLTVIVKLDKLRDEIRDLRAGKGGEQ